MWASLSSLGDPLAISSLGLTTLSSYLVWKEHCTYSRAWSPVLCHGSLLPGACWEDGLFYLGLSLYERWREDDSQEPGPLVYALIHSQIVANTEHQLGTPGCVTEQHRPSGCCYLGNLGCRCCSGLEDDRYLWENQAGSGELDLLQESELLGGSRVVLIWVDLAGRITGAKNCRNWGKNIPW